MRLAEVAGVLAVRQVAAGAADRPRQQDVRRALAAGALEVAERRSRRAGARRRRWKSRPVCIIWWPVSWTAVAVW